MCKLVTNIIYVSVQYLIIIMYHLRITIILLLSIQFKIGQFLVNLPSYLLSMIKYHRKINSLQYVIYFKAHINNMFTFGKNDKDLAIMVFSWLWFYWYVMQLNLFLCHCAFHYIENDFNWIKLNTVSRYLICKQ